MKASNILGTIGNTPHVRIQRLFGDTEVWIKLERANPGGSIKDRIGLSMVEDAEQARNFEKGKCYHRTDFRQYGNRPGDSSGR